MLSQKIRSLHSGLPSGLRFEEIKGRHCLSLHNVPFELEDFVFRWLSAVPSEHRLQIVLEDIYLTEVGWSAFIEWMTEAIASVQRGADFEDSVVKNLKLA